MITPASAVVSAEQKLASTKEDDSGRDPNAPSWRTLLLVTPLTLVFLAFFVVPILLVIAVSFFNYESYQILIPAFTLQNYIDVFTESTTWDTYLATFQFCLIVWVITFVLGFALAYFMAFYIRSVTWQMVMFLICTIPFWTSNVIRMISWIPLLGRNGIVNSLLLNLGVVRQPQEWLLYSSFSVILGFIHLYTMFMIVPIFNSMVRIDKALIEAATDAGASQWQTIRHVILPLCKPGIAIGSIFVITIVMGDFVTVTVLGGGQVASVGKSIWTDLSYLQFPPAAANAMVLLAIVILMIVGLTRIIDIRKEL
ncbi:putative spermidine/putrescine transport system permease protein [Arboricoccus pini]|uniref:Putative spermidine/putrescine transport system permease protein n=1 Tax=Arboricoccus pini TaxID=1963835 RepID=A0A212QT15_9PROT|nr:putative spermidine/putrescine transport system permease protein [Arboricoccus pini]